MKHSLMSTDCHEGFRFRRFPLKIIVIGKKKQIEIASVVTWRQNISHEVKIGAFCGTTKINRFTVVTWRQNISHEVKIGAFCGTTKIRQYECARGNASNLIKSYRLVQPANRIRKIGSTYNT